MEFIDRVSAYPNRYLLTNENGDTSYVYLERADEPTVVGTPLNADTFNSLSLYAESKDHPGCYFRTADGETEWLNPPAVLNVEYRTAERHMGKPVYTKVLYAKLNSEAVMITSPCFAAVKWHGYTSLGGSLPTTNPNAAWAIDVQISSYSITFHSGSSIVSAAPEAYLQVWYTK